MNVYKKFCEANLFSGIILTSKIIGLMSEAGFALNDNNLDSDLVEFEPKINSKHASFTFLGTISKKITVIYILLEI